MYWQCSEWLQLQLFWELSIEVYKYYKISNYQRNQPVRQVYLAHLHLFIIFINWNQTLWINLSIKRSCCPLDIKSITLVLALQLNDTVTNTTSMIRKQFCCHIFLVYKDTKSYYVTSDGLSSRSNINILRISEKLCSSILTLLRFTFCPISLLNCNQQGKIEDKRWT